jgi:DNA polymerase-3 subunit delta
MGVHLLTGDDESMLRGAVIELVDSLVGDGDRTMMVDEFDGSEYELQHVTDAAQTPPFLTDRRVVLARGVGRFSAGDVGPLVGYLADPLESTELVLVGGGGTIPKSLVDAVKAAGGHVRSTSVAARGRERLLWVRSRAEAKGLTLDDRAVARLVDWLGEGSGALDGVLDTIAAVHTGRARVSADEIEPLLGDAGGVPPWDLTDAIDAGDTARALALLHRMVNGGGRHPLQVMAILHQHIAKMARLDGSGATDQDSAAAVLGIKSSFPAKKALDGARRLGTDDLRRAIGLLATADSDLRGGTGLDELAVMEVLVARLARLGPHARAGTSRRR